jgi:prepilin-type N-terminal cleavage/methylation domain-containing protein
MKLSNGQSKRHFQKGPVSSWLRRKIKRCGFTMIEMIVALSIFVLLIGGIFAIANGTLELSSDLVYAQERALMRQNLIEFLRKSFRTLPGDASIELRNQNVGGTYLPTLTIYAGGTAFSPGPALPMEASIEVYSEQRPGGYLRIGLRGLDAEQTRTARLGKGAKVSQSSEIPLLDNVSRFEWRFFDPRANQWVNFWKEQQGRPMFAELGLSLDDGQEVRAVFWIPPIARGSSSGIPQQPGLIPGSPGTTPGAPGQPGVTVPTLTPPGGNPKPR